MRFAHLILVLAALLPIRPAGAVDLDLGRMLTAAEHRDWHAVGRVNIASFSERAMCTGTLVSSDLVLTAAHCVVSDRTGERFAPGNITFVAGWRQGQLVAKRKAAKVTVHPRYNRLAGTELEQIGADIALIRLERPIPETTVQPFQVAPVALAEDPLVLISYRRDRAHALSRQDGCDIRGAGSGVLALGCDVTFGASGSPVFTRISGEIRLVAVISAMSRMRGQPIAWAVQVDNAMPDVLSALD